MQNKIETENIRKDTWWWNAKIKAKNGLINECYTELVDISRLSKGGNTLDKVNKRSRKRRWIEYIAMLLKRFCDKVNNFLFIIEGYDNIII